MVNVLLIGQNVVKRCEERKGVKTLESISNINEVIIVKFKNIFYHYYMQIINKNNCQNKIMVNVLIIGQNVVLLLGWQTKRCEEGKRGGGTLKINRGST